MSYDAKYLSSGIIDTDELIKKETMVPSKWDG